MVVIFGTLETRRRLPLVRFQSIVDQEELIVVVLHFQMRRLLALRRCIFEPLDLVIQFIDTFRE